MEAAGEPVAPGGAAASGGSTGFGSALEVLAVFARLGLSSFGGPVAHLGYFHAELVSRRRWLDEGAYADLVALCQFLPGPASSQVGMGVGIARAGLLGGLAAWLGFTLPSALLMLAFALGLQWLGLVQDAAWLPGEEGGPAIAEALFGRSTPGGKLPVSFPRSSAQIPVYYNHKPSGGRSHWKGSYVDMPTTPLFPFGHGLSYTTFGYHDLNIEPASVAPGGRVRVSLDVTNEGARRGDEVVQLYLHDVVASLSRPVKQLAGFVRLSLDPGESKRVTFEVPVSLIAFLDREMELVVEPGTIEVLLGGSSADIRLQGSFEVEGSTQTVVQRELASRVSVG